MLRRMRLAPAVRVVLVAAAALALVASFGLHPEPLGAGGFASHRGLSSAHHDDAPHACPACLTHAAALLTPAVDPLAVDSSDARAAFGLEPHARSRRATLELAGRSPPAGRS
jgi:hypothetical protein